MAARTLIQAINDFIGQGHALSGHGADLVRAGQSAGVDPRVLAIIARKESTFGDASFAPHNAWGWGVHAGPSVNTFPTWLAGATAVARGLSGSLYKGSGLTKLSQIIPKYAPPSENDTGLYIKQITDWYRQMGGNPGASVFGGQSVSAPAPAGGSPAPVAQAAAGGASSPLAMLAALRQLNAPGANRIGALEQIMALRGSGAPQMGAGAAGGGSAPAPSPGDPTGAGSQYGTPFGTTFTLPGLPSFVKELRATGSIRNPKGQSVPTTTFDGKPVSDWWASVLTFARQHGWTGSVNSGYRTVAEQRRLFAGHPDPRWVARPGSSPHNYGMAVDISQGPQLEQVIRRYHLPVARYAAEGWHFEPLGFRTNGTQRTFG